MGVQNRDNGTMPNNSLCVKIKDTFKRKDLSDNDLQLITKFRETEKVENEYVMSKYKEKNKQKGDVLDDDIVAELESTK